MSQYNPLKLSVRDIEDAINQTGYKATPKEEDEAEVDGPREEASESKEDVLKQRVIWTAIFTLPLFYVSMAPMIGIMLPGPIDHMTNPIPYALLQLILTIPVMWLGRSYFEQGFKTLFKGHPNMNSLISLGTVAAFVYSVAATYAIIVDGADLAMMLYYETAAVILAFHTLGKYLEERSKGRMSEAIQKLMDLAPKTARIVHNGEEVEVAVESVSPGDIVRVRPGEKMPVDGVIIKGRTAVDESMLTGESMQLKRVKVTTSSVLA